MRRYVWVENSVAELEPGVAYEARMGREFMCLPQSFVTVVYRAAAARGWKATVTVIGNSVVYAFYRADSFMRPNLAAYPVVKKMRG